jgi:FAD synthetase
MPAEREASASAASSPSTQATATATTTATKAIVTNWRVLTIPREEDDPVVDGEIRDDGSNNFEVLHQREAWREAQYRDALELHHRLTSCEDSYVRSHILSALNWLDHAYRLYGETSVVCSFNGGKDAVVILHLLRAALASYHQRRSNSINKQQQPLRRPRVIYFEHDHEFPEMLDFLRRTVQQYDLDMIAFERGTKFPRGLRALVDHHDSGGPVAFVLGTRSGDPNAGNQGYFSPSSHYMPPFLRVNPILDWSYGHVWHFLRLFQLPYCALYDRGYTSLGTTLDTLPCPALAVAGATSASSATATTAAEGGSCLSAIPKYWPAYMLRDWDQERAGRISKDNSSKALSKKPAASQRAATAARPDALAETTPAVEGRALSSANSSQSVDRLSTFSEARRATTCSEESQIDCDPRDPDLVASSVHPPTTLGGGEDASSSSSWVSYSDEDTVTQKTVGLLIIGDEILKGYTVDTNTRAAAQALRDQNVLLRKVVVVSDDQDEIVMEIGRLRQEVDVLITSGGVGPTHDDVTIKSVAVALGCDLVLHEGMVTMLRDKMNGGDPTAKLTEAQVKMATLPRFSKLRYLTDNPKDWPVLQCRNIFILPGIPEFFTAKIDSVSKYLSCQLERGAAYKVVLSVDENSIVPILNQVVENHPNVSFGSYPFVSHPDFKTVITVEARLLSRGGRSNSVLYDRTLIDIPKQQLDAFVERALDELLTTLPGGSILRVDNDDMLLYS